MRWGDGEESGCISVKGHIPERDGIWMGLLIMELMAKSGKSLKELIQILYGKIGEFKFNRNDLHLNTKSMEYVLNKLKSNQIKEIGGRPIIKTETIDGWKFYLDEDTWIMARPSGTELLYRVYCQAKNKAAVKKTLEDALVALQS